VFSQLESSALDRPAEAALLPALPKSTYEKQSPTGKRLYEHEPGKAEDDVQESEDRLPGPLETDGGLADSVHQGSYR
jgi:hypothetical protein